MRTALVLLVLLASAPTGAQEATARKQAPAARKVRFNGRQLGHYEGTTPGQNMNLASDGTTTCVSTPSYSRCTGE